MSESASSTSGAHREPASRFIQIARALDDDALAALGNRGLVRRARKDLDRTAPHVEGSEGDRLVVRVEDVTVHLASNPAASTCSCPADGVCRHVLAAWMFLAGCDLPAAPDGAADATPIAGGGALSEALAVPDAELRAHHGVAALRRANAELSAGLEVDARRIDAGVLAVPEWNVEVRWVPGAGLSGTLCSCHAPTCLHRVVAVVGLQVAKGGRTLDAEPSPRSESAEAPRSRDELLSAVGLTLVDCVEPGLCRLATSTVDRLRTLGTSAHGVDLPRLERELQGLAGELESLLARSASASSESAALRCARLDALRRALSKSAHTDLTGEHRRRFVRVGTLSLVGLGAECLITASGYAALVCYFWDAKAQRFATWSEARPRGAQGFDPSKRLVAPGPWHGCRSPLDAATHHGRLTGAWIARDGRLSARTGVRYERLAPTDVTDVPAVRAWPELGAVARRTFANGLAGASATESLVLLHPAKWQVRGFRDVEQHWLARIEDGDARVLDVRLPYTEATQRGIRALEARTFTPETRLLGRIRIERGATTIEPISFLDRDGVLSASAVARGTLRAESPDASRESAPVAAEPERPGDAADVAEGDEEDVLADADGELPLASGEGGLIFACERLRGELVDYIERGTRTPAPGRLLALGAELGHVAGMRTLAAAVARLSEEPSSAVRAQRVLSAVYLLDQTVRLIAVEQAVAAGE